MEIATNARSFADLNLTAETLASLDAICLLYTSPSPRD